MKESEKEESKSERNCQEHSKIIEENKEEIQDEIMKCNEEIGSDEELRDKEEIKEENKKKTQFKEMAKKIITGELPQK